MTPGGRLSGVGLNRDNMEAQAMSKVLAFIETFRKDEDGAALVEYTVLLGILLVAVIATISPSAAG